jgi:hypothetical protein
MSWASPLSFIIPNTNHVNNMADDMPNGPRATLSSLPPGTKTSSKGGSSSASSELGPKIEVLFSFISSQVTSDSIF